MRKYLVFENGSDILIARILSEEKDTRIIVKSDDGTEFSPTKFELGGFVACLFNYDIDSRYAYENIPAYKKIIETNQPQYVGRGYSQHEVTVAEAKKYIDEYNKKVEFCKTQYYVDKNTGKIMCRDSYGRKGNKGSEVTYPLCFVYNEKTPYILEFDDDTDASAQLWAEVKKPDYKMARNSRNW